MPYHLTVPEAIAAIEATGLAMVQAEIESSRVTVREQIIREMTEQKSNEAQE